MMENPNKLANDDEKYIGFGMDFIRELQKRLGFEYELHLNTEFGTLDPDTLEWNGMIRELIEGVITNS